MDSEKTIQILTDAEKKSNELYKKLNSICFRDENSNELDTILVNAVLAQKKITTQIQNYLNNTLEPTKPNLKYIYRTAQGVYQIVKLINKKQVYFGTYPSLKSAIEKRDYLIKHNWPRDGFKRYDKTRRKKYNNTQKYKEDYCISKVNNAWEIRRKDPETGKLLYYGRFKNIEDARHERDLLIKCNWDLDTLCDLY